MGSILSKNCPCLHSRGKYDFPQKGIPVENVQESTKKDSLSNSKLTTQANTAYKSQGMCHFSLRL